MADQQVLWFAHQGAYASQRRAHCTVHQQAAQKGAELLQVVVVQGWQMLIVAIAAVLARVIAGGHPVVHRVEAHRGADDHCGHGQGVEKGREEGRKKAEQQPQKRLGAHPQQ